MHFLPWKETGRKEGPLPNVFYYPIMQMNNSINAIKFTSTKVEGAFGCVESILQVELCDLSSVLRFYEFACVLKWQSFWE